MGRGGDCAGSLSAADAAWTELYLAVSRRDAAAMATTGAAVLTEIPQLADPEQRAYVVTAAMLGLLRDGRPSEALQFWRSHGEVQFARSGIPEYTRLVLQRADRAAN